MIKDPSQVEDVAQIIYNVLETSRLVGLLLKPILPDLSIKILKQLSINDNIEIWGDSLVWGLLQQGLELSEPIPIIDRIEIDI